jgi:hypothetical protein
MYATRHEPLRISFEGRLYLYINLREQVRGIYWAFDVGEDYAYIAVASSSAFAYPMFAHVDVPSLISLRYHGGR